MKKECESCGDMVEPETLELDFLGEMSCANCRRQHRYMSLIEQGKVPSEIKKELDTVANNQITKFMATGKFDHSMAAQWFDKLGI